MDTRLQHKYTEKLEVLGAKEKPEQKHYEQFMTSIDSILADIKVSFNVTSYQYLNVKNVVDNRAVKKETLCEYLEAACCLLHKYAAPLLMKEACEIQNLRIDTSNYEKMFEKTKEKINNYKTEISKFQKEKILLQESVITLQSKVIEAQESYVKSVQSTVQNTVENEMKSYASAVSKSCNAALTAKKIQSAVKKVSEIEERTKNIVIYGIQETEDIPLEDTIGGILKSTEVEEELNVRSFDRVGTLKTGSTRPVRITLNSNTEVNRILKNSKNLRNKEGFNKIYICPDRSVEERRAYKKLVEELKKTKIAMPDKVHYIRNNKIVSADKKC